MGLRTLENFFERRFFGTAAPVPYTGGTPVLPSYCAAGECWSENGCRFDVMRHTCVTFFGRGHQKEKMSGVLKAFSI